MPAQAPQTPIPLATDVAEGDISGEEILVNVFPRANTGGKYPFSLVGSPGLAYVAELPTFPVLGLHKAFNKTFAVTPTKFYQIYPNGTYREIGDVTLNPNVVIDDNGLQLVIVDGTSGYAFDNALDTITKITDPDFYPARSVTEQDGYFIFDRINTDLFFISDLLSVTFSGDIQQAGGKTDPIVRVISDHREVFLFGTETTRVQYNSGNVDFPFELNQGAYIEKGCGAPYSVAKQNNTLYFIGSDLMVYEMVGYTPKRISTHAVEKSLSGVDLSNAFGYAHQEDGHLFYTLTIPASNKTWRFDISTRSWHICEDFHFGRHRSNCVVWDNPKTLVGDFQSGRIYQMVSGYNYDDGDLIVRRFILPTINAGREFISINAFELDMSSGVGNLHGLGVDPVAELRFSKDGKRWSNIKTAKIGKMGKYLSRVRWKRLGSARQFIIEIRIAAPVDIDIGGAWIEAQ